MIENMADDIHGGTGENPAFGMPTESETSETGPGEPETSPEHEALVKKWTKRVQLAKGRFETRFKKMRADMKLIRHGADGSWNVDTQYTTNIAQRVIGAKVAALYAKSPRVIAQRKPRLEYTLWDGNPQTLMMAQEAVSSAMSGQPSMGGALLDPMTAMAIIQDAQNGHKNKMLYERIGKTLEIVFKSALDEQEPRFKKSMKATVRRACATGVAYCRIGYQRIMERAPLDSARIEDVTMKLAKIEQLLSHVSEGDDRDRCLAEQVELKAMLQSLQEPEAQMVREGLVFEFPKSTSIIPDPQTRNVDGWVGTRWIAHERMMTPDEIERVYQVKMEGKGFTVYSKDQKAGDTEFSEVRDTGDDKTQYACVWDIQDKDTGTVFTICEGYKGFLMEPATPDIELERFFDIFTLAFNQVEDESDPFPLSDAELIRHPQNEYNRAREGLREHRQFSRPKWAAGRDRLEDEDKAKLACSEAFDLVELKALREGESVEKLLQKFPVHNIDPNMYETGSVFEDVMRAIGVQEANLGPTSGGTATESSIAEESRVSSLASNTDDLDEFLTDLARAGGQILLQHMTEQTAKKIAGPGAVWPTMSRQEIAEEVYLEIKAGSSGRPNKAQDLANFERISPTLIQIPGIPPKKFAEEALRRMDDNLDIEEWFVEGMPSIVALNAMQGRPAQPSTGDPATDPGQQGPAGQDNAAGPQQNENEPGPQPGYPAPGQAGMMIR